MSVSLFSVSVHLCASVCISLFLPLSLPSPLLHPRLLSSHNSCFHAEESKDLVELLSWLWALNPSVYFVS